jgi:DNA-binding NarL/FixJ family response regulator
VLDLIGRHVNWTGFWPINWLCCTDTAVVDSVYRDLVEMVADGTLSARVDRDMLLDAGEREAALHQLDAAWDDYDHLGAFARRAGFSASCGKRAPGAQSGSATTTTRSPGRPPRPNDEWRIWVADGHTHKVAARALGISVNTVGTHLRWIYSKLAVQSRVQLANALRERGELN